jgi:hypothetical protein
MEDNIELPTIPEPTREEVEMTIETLSEKYHRTFTYDDAAKFLKLTYELNIWQNMEKDAKSEAVKSAKSTQKLYKAAKDEKVSRKRAELEAEKSIILAIAKNALRIDQEIKELLK